MIKNKGGFTVVEMAVVLVVICILVVIALPEYHQAWIASKASACGTAIKQIEMAKNAYKRDYPNATNILDFDRFVSVYLNGSLPVDPWGVGFDTNKIIDLAVVLDHPYNNNPNYEPAGNCSSLNGYNDAGSLFTTRQLALDVNNAYSVLSSGVAFNNSFLAQAKGSLSSFASSNGISLDSSAQTSNITAAQIQQAITSLKDASVAQPSLAAIISELEKAIDYMNNVDVLPAGPYKAQPPSVITATATVVGPSILLNHNPTSISTPTPTLNVVPLNSTLFSTVPSSTSSSALGSDNEDSGVLVLPTK